MNDQHIKFGDCSNQSKIILGQFTNGCLQPEKKSLIRFGRYTSEKKNHMIAETNQMQYYGERNTASENFRYMVGILDKDTGKVRVHETEQYTFRPVCKGTTVDAQSDDDEEVKSKSFVEKKDELTKAFGSVKRKKAMNARFTNKVTKEKLELDMSVAVKDALERPDIENALKVAPVVRTSLAIPPHVEGAKSGDEAYPMDEMLSKADFIKLAEPAKKLIEYTEEDLMNWTENKSYCKFVLRALHSLPLTTQERKYRSCVLMYIQYIVALLNSKPFTLSKGQLNLHEDVPSNMPVKQKIFSVFTEQVGRKKTERIMSKMLKDKAICHLLVLALSIEEFTINYSLFTEDIHLTEEQLWNYLSILGCSKTSRSSGNHTAHLRLPLKVKKTKFNFKKR